MKKILMLLSVLMISLSCEYQKETDKKSKGLIPVILVSKDADGIFETWLNRSAGRNDLKCIDMYPFRSIDSLKALLREANGIIISGGVDVNPEIYNKKDEIDRCGKIDNYRDILEQIMIRYAIDTKIPLLGVCRGHQILNVTLGGTLIIDIPEDTGSDSLHRKNGRINHMVYLKKASFLYNIVKVDSGQVLSNHHQAVDELASELNISSYASDSIVESLEAVDTLSHPFILGVQWHPEGMDVRNPLSGKIARRFIHKLSEHMIN